MRVRHRHGRSPRGLGLVEFVIVLPVAIVFVLGLVQAGFIYMAKLQVNHATFQAARLGSLHNADEGVMKTALLRSLSPFYQNNIETNDSVRLAKAKVDTELDQVLHPVKLERLNPSAQSFEGQEIQPHEAKYGRRFGPRNSFDPGRLSARLPLHGERLGGKMHLGLVHTQQLPAAMDTAASQSHQLTRWSTSWSGAGCAARSQPGSPCTPSSTCASQSSHSGGPRAGVMCGGSESAPMCSSICRISTLWVMNAMMRICPPHMGHSSGKRWRVEVR